MPRPTRFDDGDLLDASYDLLWRDGCDAVSIRDIEAALGVKAPSLYRRFHSRAQLVTRSVDRYVERVVTGRVRRHLAGSDDPVEGIRSFFVSALEPAGDEDRPRGCLLTVTSGQAAVAEPGVRAAVVAGIGVVEGALRTQVGRAHGDGRTGPGTDPDALAVALLLAFEGLMVLARTGRPGLVPAVEQLLTVCFPVHPSDSTPESATTTAPAGNPVPANGVAPVRSPREELQP